MRPGITWKFISFGVNNRMIFVTPGKSLYRAYVKYASAASAVVVLVVVYDTADSATALNMCDKTATKETEKETKGHFAHHLSSNES